MVIVGDISHSRVARSNVFLLTRMGAKVRVAAPALADARAASRSWASRSTSASSRRLDGADVVMMLRIQRERQGKVNFPSPREYYDFFALTPERLQARRARTPW